MERKSVGFTFVTEEDTTTLAGGMTHVPILKKMQNKIEFLYPLWRVKIASFLAQPRNVNLSNTATGRESEEAHFFPRESTAIA